MALRKLLMFGAMTLNILLVYRTRIVCMDATESAVPVLVERQLGNDTVHFSSALNVKSCNTDNKFTYLVDDRRCVASFVDRTHVWFADKHAGCKFTIASDESITLRVAVDFLENQQINNTVTLLVATGTNSSSIAVIIDEVHQQGVNSCRIDNLEVYRGRKKAIEISHDGFSINKNGSIQIDEAGVMYSIDEFKGELYRMNVTCSKDENEESGCLFLKIIGVSNINKAKFDGLVSGIIPTQNGRMVTDESNPSRITVIDIVTYSISAVAGILLLFFIVVLICLACCYCKCTCCTKTEANTRNRRKAPHEQTSDVIPSKLKRELDLSYLVSDAIDINYTSKEALSSSERPTLSGY